MNRVLFAFLLSTSLLTCSFCVAADEPADYRYRVRVLVRDFDAPGVPEAWGSLAAETIAAALDAHGLALSLRPTYKIEAEWGLSVDGTVVDTRRARSRRHETEKDVDVYAAPERKFLIKEKNTPSSDFFIEGALSSVDTTWWLTADIFKRGTRKKLKSAVASGEGNTGLLLAAQKVAMQLESVYASQVISHRAEAILRAVELERMQRPLAAAKLERMHHDWPAALEPAAARLSLEATQAAPDGEALVSWGKKVAEGLRVAPPESQRFLLRLNLDPYTILAGQYRTEGNPLAAALAHLEGAENHPGDRHTHWMKAAQIYAGLSCNREAASAYEGALNLKPVDPETVLELGLLFEKLEDNVAATRWLSLFLKQAPKSPRAAEIRAKLDSLKPVGSPVL